MATTMRYLFLRIYSNRELQAYLTAMLAQGWVLMRCRGNFLSFRRRCIKNARLCVVSTECTKADPAGDEQVDEYIAIARKKGWQLLCIGDFESVIPMRRRLYFYTQEPDVPLLEPDEVIEFQNAYRAYHSTRRWIIGWSLLAVAVVSSTVLFMRADGVHPAFLLIDASLVALALTSVFLFIDRRRLYLHVTEYKPMPEDSYMGLRRRENCMSAALMALLLGVIALLFS